MNNTLGDLFSLGVLGDLFSSSDMIAFHRHSAIESYIRLRSENVLQQQRQQTSNCKAVALAGPSAANVIFQQH